jgi:hypothetical protein
MEINYEYLFTVILGGPDCRFLSGFTDYAEETRPAVMPLSSSGDRIPPSFRSPFSWTANPQISTAAGTFHD